LRPHVVLIPGFFGFANLGDFAYFKHVIDAMERALADRGLDGAVHVVATYPTASLSRRAARVAETLSAIVDAEPGAASSFHLIGHSSGGIDARLLTARDVTLPTEAPVAALADRVRTVVTLSSPHFGSPLAAFLSSVFGAQILRLLSLFTIYRLRTGRVPVGPALQLAHQLALFRILGRFAERFASGTLVENLYRDLLSQFSADRRAAIVSFFDSVGQDQELLAQVTPAGMDLVNATTVPRADVRYGSVVTRALRPGLRTHLAVGPSPFRQLTHLLFRAAYRLTASSAPAPRTISDGQRAALVNAFGVVPDGRDNDGFVPTLSQVWGEILFAAEADHLDTLGHIQAPRCVPPHYDWLNSGCDFSLDDFHRLWERVAAFVFDEAATVSVGGANGAGRGARRGGLRASPGDPRAAPDGPRRAHARRP